MRPHSNVVRRHLFCRLINQGEDIEADSTACQEQTEQQRKFMREAPDRSFGQCPANDTAGGQRYDAPQQPPAAKECPSPARWYHLSHHIHEAESAHSVGQAGHGEDDEECHQQSSPVLDKPQRGNQHCPEPNAPYHQYPIERQLTFLALDEF